MTDETLTIIVALVLFAALLDAIKGRGTIR